MNQRDVSPDFAAAKLDGDLAALEREWAPYSKPEAIWRGCPGHEWERIVWEGEKITRCGRCGAPRCTTYDGEAAGDAWGWLDDQAQQLYRCTAERHHEDEHDYLTG